MTAQPGETATSVSGLGNSEDWGMESVLSVAVYLLVMATDLLCLLSQRVLRLSVGWVLEMGRHCDLHLEAGRVCVYLVFF